MPVCHHPVVICHFAAEDPGGSVLAEAPAVYRLRHSKCVHQHIPRHLADEDAPGGEVLRVNIILAFEFPGQLDPMCNAYPRESTGPEMPRPPPFIAWSRTTSINSSASGTSGMKIRTDSGVPSSGTSSNSSWIVVI